MHEAAILAYVRRLLPSRTHAEDVMQGVALVLWTKFEQFREDGDFRSWAFGVARYEVLAWLRDRGRDRLVLSGDVAEIIADAISHYRICSRPVDSEARLSNLLLTMLQKMDVETETFQDSVSAISEIVA